MYADPLVLPTKASALTTASNLTFPAVERASDHSTYVLFDATSGYTFTVFMGHQYGKRQRHTIRMTAAGMDTDPLNASLKVPFSQSVYVVADVPQGGYVGGSTYATSLMVQQCGVIGNLLLAAGANPSFLSKNLAGET
jgi:hypothetical protein